MANIQLTTRLNLDDSQFKSGISGVETILKKMSTASAFVKLKLDDSDFRRKYQKDIAEMSEGIRKAYGAKRGEPITYKNAKGNATKLDTIGSLQTGYKYAVGQSVNGALTKAEQSMWAARAESIAKYLIKLKEIGLETKNVAKAEKELADMPFRADRARRSAQIAYEKKKEYAKLTEPEDKERQADELFRRRYMAFAAEQTKMDKEQEARIAQLQKEANARSVAAVKEYDSKIAKGTDTLTPELKMLRDFYTQQNRNIAAEVRRLQEFRGNSDKIYPINQGLERARNRRETARSEGDLQGEIRANREILNLLRQRYKLTGDIKDLEKANRYEDIIHSQQRRVELERKTAEHSRNKIKYEELFGKEVKNTNGSLQTQSGIGTNLLNIFSRYISLFTIINFGRKIAETTGYFQQQQVALEGILGSATEAKKALDQIKDWALESPFQTNELVRYVKQLSAYGIESKNLINTTKELADISAGLGVDMNRLILAYGQVKSAAVLRGQELRQFTEAGIPMVQALADKFTQLNGRLVTTGEVFKLISERKVSFEMVADVLSDMTKEGGKFHNMQENLTNTLYGQIQKIKDMWTLAMNDFGSSLNPLLNGIVSGIQFIIKNAKTLLTGGSVAAIALGAKKLIGSWGTIKKLWMASRIEMKLIGVEIHNAAIRTKMAEAGAIRWTQGLKGVARVAKQIGRVLFSNVGIAALSAIVSLISSAASNANKLGRALDEVDETFNKDLRKQVSGLEKLVGTLASSTKGTKAYNDALSTLKSNYGDFVSDAMIESVENNTRAWKDLEASIKGAIEAKAEYDKHVARMEKAGEIYREGASEDASFIGKLFKGSRSDLEEIIIDVAKGNKTSKEALGLKTDYELQLLAKGNLFGMNALKSSQGDSKQIGLLTSAIDSSLEEFFAENMSTKEDFKKLIDKNIQTYAPDFGYLAEALAEKAFEDLSNSDAFAKYKADFDAIQNDPYYKNDQAFKEAQKRIKDLYQGLWEGDKDSEYKTSSKKSKEYDPFKYGDDVTKEFIDAVFGRYDDGKDGQGDDFRDRILEAVVNQSGIKSDKYVEAIKTIKQLDDLFGNDFYTGKTNDIADLLTKLSETLEDGELRNQLKNLIKTFVESAGTISGVAAKIDQNIRNNFGAYTAKSAEMKDFFARWEATDQTLEQKRNDLVSTWQDLDSKIKSHSGQGDVWKDQIKQWEQDKKWLEILAGKDYYDVILDKKNGGGGGAGGGWRRLFSDLFGYIKEARAEEKKLVEHSAGLTEELANQIGSEKLQGTAVDAFWESMQGKENSPFKKFIDKMGEYGLETKVFTEDFLKKSLGGIIADQIKATGTVNYKDVWKQLIEVINNRADELSKNTEMEKTVEAMKTYLQQMTIEGEKFFSRNAVEKLIEDQLKEMRKINGQFEAVRNTQKAYEGIRGASNASIARRVLGTGGIISNADLTASQLATLLSAGYGKGIANASPELKKLVNGGGISIANIGQLLAIREDLAGKTTKDMSGATEEERQANFVEFKNILQEFDKLLNQLTTDILDDYKRLMELRNPVNKASDSIINAYDEFSKNEGIRALAWSNGTIDTKQSGEMRLQNIQNLYDNIAKGLGGKGMPEYIKALFGDVHSNTGVNETGFNLGMWLGEGSLVERVANYRASQLKREDYESDEEFEEAVKKATDSMQKFAARMELTSAIIKRIDDYTQKAAQFANQLIDALEANNGLTLDEYGNVTYENDYSTAKYAINTIAEFSSGISSAFQSLMSGDIFGALMGVGGTLAKFFQNIFGIGDAQIQKQQDKLLSSNKSLERAMTNLQHVLQDVAGKDKWDNLTEQIKNLREQEKNNDLLYDMEMQKKHGDADKAESFRDRRDESKREAEDIIRGIREEILGTADELATTLTDAMVEAFRNGENAARAWRDTVREYMGDVLKDVLMQNILAPKIQELFKQVGIDEENTSASDIMSIFSNAEKMVDLRNNMFALGTEMGDWFNSLPEAIKEMIAWNSDTSELSGGISGITEDTARTLEGLANSILAQHVITNRYIQDIPPFLQAQLSKLKDIQVQIDTMAKHTEIMKNVLSGSYDGVRSLRVTIE